MGMMLILFTSCSEKKTRETPNGFKFELAKKGGSEVARPNQFVVFDYTVTDSKDSVWASSYARGYPEFSKIQDSSRMWDEDGITQMLRMLAKGDSATFIMPVVDLFRDFAQSSVPPHIDSTMSVRYCVSVRDIVSPEDVPAYQQKIEEEYMAFAEKNAKAQLAKDTVEIDDYLDRNNINAERLPSGIRYVIRKQGVGPNATTGQSVSVNYSGYLLDGTLFDTSIKELAQQKGVLDPGRESQNGYKPYEVVIDQTSVIRGWHIALKELNKGARGTFYIPSPLAYGPQASGKIKANAVLVFDIEMVDIKD